MLTEMKKMTAYASITITPILVADLLVEGEQMPVYVSYSMNDSMLVSRPAARDSECP
jgi:hypothetical protein